MSDKVELVTVFIDGNEVKVPKGTNIIEAAKKLAVEIPHYCYHKDLSIAGNCRMCQVQVEGMPKLQIACNLGATEGMKVKTHFSSPEVEEAQRATLEFLLINHPLDCTVCDQAGHCKLQDYYYEYNSKPSRFTEDKVNKVKAERLGDEIVYDGERCIVCTRCVRFCDEVTGTSELGVFNRGDKAVIGTNAGIDLNNPFSGTVVDLCPVGALTHERWRFNTRIWYTKQVDSVCTGCSTGCNAKVVARDGRVVMVKARYNEQVNKEWMCDEGRYGFARFQPERRLETPMKLTGERYEPIAWDDAIKEASQLSGQDTAVFISPLLPLEEIWTALKFSRTVLGLEPRAENVAMQFKQRELTDLQQILISPDYAPNVAASALFNIVSGDGDYRGALQKKYQNLLSKVKAGSIKKILLVGDGAICYGDLDAKLTEALSNAELSVNITPNGSLSSGTFFSAKLILPSRTVNEKGGVMANKDFRLQVLRQILDEPFGGLPDWMILKRVAEASGKAILPAGVLSERDLTREMANQVEFLKGLSYAKLGEKGLLVTELLKEKSDEQTGAAA